MNYINSEAGPPVCVHRECVCPYAAVFFRPGVLVSIFGRVRWDNWCLIPFLKKKNNKKKNSKTFNKEKKMA